KEVVLRPDTQRRIRRAGFAFSHLPEVLPRGERRISDHAGLSARRQDHLHLGVVAMLRDRAADPERIVVRMREHERKPTFHSPSSGSRPTVSPGRPWISLIASKTPGMNDVRSIESCRIDNVCP